MPIEEYVKEDAPAVSGKRVLVEMKSTQSDMTGVGFFTVRRGKEGDTSFDKLLADESSGEKNNEYSLVSEGIMEIKDERVVLSYQEAAIAGTEGCTTVISFDPLSPECVTVERCGPLSSVFVISRGERLFSVYSTPYGNIDMCIYAKRVENTLGLGGGCLELDYAVELKGLTAQRTRMSIKVREINA